MNKQILSKLFSYNQSFRRFSYKPIKRPSLSQLKDLHSKATSDNTPPLHEYLTGKIKAVGPISVADYMKEALTNGYYMNRDVFGQKGDFITSPEIGQIVGRRLVVHGMAENRFTETISNHRIVARKETPMMKLFLASLDANEQRDHIEYSVQGHLILEHLSLLLETHGGFGLVMDYGHDGHPFHILVTFSRVI